MTRYESDCVGPCPQGCIGSACPYNRVLHLYCNKCGESVDKLYAGSDEYAELCESCAEEEMKEAVGDMSFSELCDYFGYCEVNSYD